jgi:hypothetical protein
MSKEKETGHHAQKSVSHEANQLEALPDVIPNTAEEKKILDAMEDLMKKIPKMFERPDARRPTPNPPIPEIAMEVLMSNIIVMRMLMEYHTANIRSLDRSRLNGVGVKKQGFIERAYSQAEENELFMPQYLTLEKFREDFGYFNQLRQLFELIIQVRDLVWNLVIQAADVTYTDALEFYAAVREAAKRRIDGAQSIFNDLKSFFSSRGARLENGNEEPTDKELMRDFNKLLHGKMDGEIDIRNVKPKVIAGERQIIDKKFTESESVKETKEASFKE